MQIPTLYLYWGIGIVIALAIYFLVFRNLDDSVKNKIGHTLWGWKIPIILILAYFYFRDKWGYLANSQIGQYRTATVVFIALFLLWQTGLLFIDKERYKSTHAIADNRSGSCSIYQEVGDHVVLNIGSIDATAFPWPFGHETWVIPKRHFNKIDGKKNSPTQIFCKTNIIKCEDILEVPARCMDFIKSTSGFHKDNIYYGEFSTEEIETGQEITVDGKKYNPQDYESLLKDTQRLYNESRNLIKSQSTTTKQVASNDSAIKKKIRGESAFRTTPEEGF